MLPVSLCIQCLVRVRVWFTPTLCWEIKFQLGDQHPVGLGSQEQRGPRGYEGAGGCSSQTPALLPGCRAVEAARVLPALSWTP